MRQRLGQHFLKDSETQARIAAALEIQGGETIIEIGPGHGELTQELLALSDKLLVKPTIIIAEKDPSLVTALQEKFTKKENLEIIEGDAREILPSLTLKLKATSYKLIGNIPYYLTGFLLRIIGELDPLPARVVLMVQKEVAERVYARPPQMNKLAASIQIWAAPKILFRVPREAFSPPPKVDSALLLLKPHSPSILPEEREEYYAAIKILFAQPRKTLLNNVSSGLQSSKEEASRLLKNLNIDPSLRPQSLSLEQIERLSAVLGKKS